MFIKKLHVYEMPPKKDKNKNTDDKDCIKEDKDDKKIRDNKEKRSRSDDREKDDKEKRSRSDDRDRDDKDRRSRSEDKDREKDRDRDDKDRRSKRDKEREKDDKDRRSRSEDKDRERERSRSEDKEREKDDKDRRSKRDDKDREKDREDRRSRTDEREKDREDRRSKRDDKDREKDREDRRNHSDEMEGNRSEEHEDKKENKELELESKCEKELKVNVDESDFNNFNNTTVNIEEAEPTNNYKTEEKQKELILDNSFNNNTIESNTNNNEIETAKTILKYDISDRSPRLSIMKKEEKVKSERKVVIIDESQNTVKIINNDFESVKPEVIQKLDKSPRFIPPLDTSPTSSRKNKKSSDYNENNNEEYKSPRNQKETVIEDYKSPRNQKETVIEDYKSPRIIEPSKSPRIQNKNQEETVIETSKSPRNQNETVVETSKSPRLAETSKSPRFNIQNNTNNSITKLPLNDSDKFNVNINNNKLTPIDEDVNDEEELITTSEKEFNKFVEFVKSKNYDFLEFILEKTEHKNIIKAFGARLLSNNGVILYLIFENEYYVHINKFYENYSSTKFSLYDVFTINHNENKYFNDKIVVTEYYQKSDNDIEKEFRSKNDKLYQISINDSGFNTTTCKLSNYVLTDKLTYKIETVCKYENHLMDKNISKLSTNLSFENYYINETNISNFKSSLNKINSHVNNLFQLYKLFADTFKNHLDKNVIDYYINLSKNHQDLYQLYKNHEKILKQISLNDVNDRLKVYHTNTINSSIYDIDETDQVEYTRIIKKSRIHTAYLRYFDELLTNCDDEIKVLVNYTILIIKFCDSKTLITNVIQSCHEDLVNRIKTTYNTIFSDLNKFKNILNY
jgi:hypothetical protein